VRNARFHLRQPLVVRCLTHHLLQLGAQRHDKARKRTLSQRVTMIVPQPSSQPLER
jgi:hypothetical protein